MTPHRLKTTGRSRALCAGIALACSLGFACSDDSDRTPRRSNEVHPDDAHGHSGDSAAGLLANFPLGHAELSKAPQGALEIHLLDLDNVTALPIEAHALIVELTSGSETRDIEFLANPLPGEPPRASRFRSPPNAWDPNTAYEAATTLPLAGKNYRIRFPSLGVVGPHAARGHGAPIGRTTKDQELWFTPQGKYTAEDIAVNGTTTAYEKFADVDPDHSDPEPGEIVCPISKSRPNPKIVWQIGGRTYRFCCPPCIEDMVHRAKVDPDSILPPEHYVKK